MTVSIKLNGVGLEVPHFVQPERSVRSWISTLLTAATSRFKRENRVLLHDISFEIGDGERVALLGRNGAGKTTLLRVLAGTLKPTRGSIEVLGNRQALLNLGLGFNQEATVRENIFLRGTALGLRPSVIRDLMPQILEFAGLEVVANHRLATLSSGQRMRLGFAVSTSIQNDIMLLDEWFGAGDMEFVRKARARMSDRVAGSRIVVLASHNFKMLREVCARGIVIDAGTVVFDGSVDEAIRHYQAIFAAAQNKPAEEAEKARKAGESVRELREKLREERRQLRQEQRRLRMVRRKLRAKLADVSGRDGDSRPADPVAGGGKTE